MCPLMGAIFIYKTKSFTKCFWSDLQVRRKCANEDLPINRCAGFGDKSKNPSAVAFLFIVLSLAWLKVYLGWLLRETVAPRPPYITVTIQMYKIDNKLILTYNTII